MYGCSQKQAPQDPTVIVSGKIINLESEEVTLFHDGEIANGKIDGEGNFKLKFEGDEGLVYSLFSGRTRFELYLSQGDSIFITADAKNTSSTFEVQGDHEKETRYLVRKRQTETEIGLKYPVELMEKSKEGYFKLKESLFTLSKVKFEEFKKQDNIDPMFVIKEEAYFTYSPLLYDVLYPVYQASFTGMAKDSIDFPMEEVNAKLATIPLDQKQLLNVGCYTQLIDTRISNLTSEILKSDKTLTSEDKARTLAIDSLLKDKSVNDHFVYTSIKSNMEYRGPVYVKEAYEKFMKENESPKYAEKLKKLKDKWEPLGPGKDAPDFTFTNMEGQDVKLSDLKGSLVYIDIWATWCGPCIDEHPHWDELKLEYADKRVAFLTVSIDETREPWEKMVKAKKMDGYQWFAENAWKSDLTLHFMVNSIPRFILLDEAGKIIDPSAGRPSGMIRESLDKYLAKIEG
ncbi:hypothetical protein CQA01_26920 [Cyclobacterium qasimii]|nr:hypothetical protein CQA01_26920 [Cyclobacterium qasimii]